MSAFGGKADILSPQTALGIIPRYNYLGNICPPVTKADMLFVLASY
jgi:hypothetical protein